MEGSFTFVMGSMKQPAGPQFSVQVGALACDALTDPVLDVLGLTALAVCLFSVLNTVHPAASLHAFMLCRGRHDSSIVAGDS